MHFIEPDTRFENLVEMRDESEIGKINVQH